MTILEYLASRSESPEMPAEFPAELRGLLRPSTPADPAGWRSATERLLAIRGYPDDWDGEGSEAADPKLVDLALSLVAAMERADLPAPDHTMLGVNGTIVMEYYLDDWYQELELADLDHLAIRHLNKATGQTTERVIRLS